MSDFSSRSSSKTAQFSALICRLSALSQLSEEDLRLLYSLARFIRLHPPRTEIWTGMKPTAPRLLVSGWACRHRLLGDGRRQIINFILPGDSIGNLEELALPSDTSSMALTNATSVDATSLTHAAASGHSAHHGLTRAIRLLALHETALMSDHIVRLGRQTAYERMVHLMLEFHHRLQVAGLGTSDSFGMPLTQEVLADSLGLSVVHVNRTLQQVRRDGLLEIRAGQVKILDLKLMQAVADWMSIAPLPTKPEALRVLRNTNW